MFEPAGLVRPQPLRDVGADAHVAEILALRRHAWFRIHAETTPLSIGSPDPDLGTNPCPLRDRSLEHVVIRQRIVRVNLRPPSGLRNFRDIGRGEGRIGSIEESDFPLRIGHPHLLAQACESAPDTVRMLLTGYADVNAARHAVNEGNIFCFLAKPCEKDALASALNAGLARYHLVMAEKELLENTLMGSIKC